MYAEIILYTADFLLKKIYLRSLLGITFYQILFIIKRFRLGNKIV